MAVLTTPAAWDGFTIHADLGPFEELVGVENGAARAGLFGLAAPSELAKGAKHLVISPTEHVIQTDSACLWRQQKVLPFQFCASAPHDALSLKLLSRGLGTKN